MNSVPIDSVIDATLQRLGYPSRSERRDVWAKPRSALGVSEGEQADFQVVYWAGLPRAVVACRTPSKAALSYVDGPAFSEPPPVVLAFDDAGLVCAYTYDGAHFQATTTPPSWKKTLAYPPGHVSTEQAAKVTEEIASGNRAWFQNIRSQRVVGVLPRIFPEGTVILYELLQNAADSGATEAAFCLEPDALLFMHDGDPFTENDVDSISFVNSSLKPADTIGFMGLGFKAAYEITDNPEIHSPPFCLRFDNREEGGELFPIPLQCAGHQESGGFSTLFRLPLKGESRDLIAAELARFDGRPLLYIGGRLRRIKTPDGDFHLRRVRTVGTAKLMTVSDSERKTRNEYAVFSCELDPSDAALDEFARDRRLEPSQLTGRKQQTSIAIPLKGGKPDVTQPGRLQVYLPTDVTLPVGFDVQGNFLVGASRKELRSASGPWNREHFRMLPVLVADAIDWAKSQPRSQDAGWAAWYDVIPDWLVLEQRLRPSATAASQHQIAEPLRLAATFETELASRKLVPTVSSRGSLVFAAPAAAVVVDAGLEKVLPLRDLAGLSGSRVLWPSLSSQAKERLARHLSGFAATEFKASVEDPNWSGHIRVFSKGLDSKDARVQLAKILAYLEREWNNYLGDLSKCVIVPTQGGQLRAAAQEPRKVFTLPDADMAFPTDELRAHYDVVHQGFRRELNRPGEMNLDSGVTQQAVKALERTAPVLGPQPIARDIILPLFKNDRWEEIPDARLLRYTRFLMQHSEDTRPAIKESGIKLKVRGTTRRYVSPSNIYFGREYSIEGERLDRLCAGEVGVNFLSGEYLQSGRAGDDWLKFFTDLGVAARPRVIVSTRQMHESQIDELREVTEDPRLSAKTLRASSVGGIRASHYAIDDYQLDAPILRAVRRYFETKPSGWKDRIGDFAGMLSAGWPSYRNRLATQIRYAVLYSSSVETRRVPAPSTFARFLRDEPWLPVADLHASRCPSELVLNNPENRDLADKDTPLSFCEFDNRELISFLELQLHPPNSTALLRLRNAVDRKEIDRTVFEALYRELASESGLDTSVLRAEFRDHPLVLVPDHIPAYVTAGQAIFASRTTLAPYLVAIGDAFPDLKTFFTETLGIPAAEELEHYVGYLRDFVWKERPPITDNLRSAIESCYRRFFNHLNETEDHDREAALASLKQQLGSPTVVFCGTKGWVDTSKTTVIYPDTPAFERFIESLQGIAIESHLKRLAQPLSEILPILDTLNVEPISTAIRLVPDVAEPRPHPQSDSLGEHLSLLIRKAVAMVEREQEQTESTSRNVTLFLREWRRSAAAFEDVRFQQCKQITVRAELARDATLLAEVQQGAHVSAGTNHLDVSMAGELIEVFDSIADQLRRILRVDLLPAGIRDEVSSLIQSNLARLEHPGFAVYLNRRLREKGLPVEEDEELQRIVQAATGNLEAQVTAEQSEGGNEPPPEDETKSENTTGPSAGGGQRHETGGQQGSPPKPPTADEILARLPVFDSNSFGETSVVDLSATSDWQTSGTPKEPGNRGGGGPGGGGNFRTAQAYRDAYGKRGEAWVFEQEKRALADVGRPDLAERVVHKSLTHEGSPWDIESFEKTPPHKPIYVEVKSTSASDDFEVEMSVEEIRAALQVNRPYRVYRVVDVSTSKPTAYVYDFKKVARQLRFSATNVSVRLPRPSA